MVPCEVCGKEVEVSQYGRFVYVSINSSVRPRKHYYHIGCFCRNVIKKSDFAGEIALTHVLDY
jgi:hypothetical protein